MEEKYSKEKLEKAVKESNTYVDVLNYFGLKAKNGNNHTLMKKRIEKYEIDVSHFNPHINNNLKYDTHTKESFIKEVLVLNGKSWTTYNIKHKLLSYNMIKNCCSICNLKEWLGKYISLHLDHIDGNNKNNELTNLRLLCPNCHSQTDTYSGKKR